MDGSALNRIEDLKSKARGLIREQALVAGQWISEGAPIAVDSPSDESVIGHVPTLSRATVDRAVKATADAFPAFAALSPYKRAELLRAWAKLIERDEAALAALITLENGKPYAEALGELRYANQFNWWFAGEAERLNGDTIASPLGHRILTLKQPVGPSAAITPWNFPAAMITRKVAPAFAAGCTVVLKPAMETPFTALALGALALEAGFPEGVFSIVTGTNEVVGPALTSSPLLRKLSFTGSTGVGRLLAEQCAPTLKKLSLELGGAAPLLVFDDADLDLAVDGAMKAKFRGAGQTCVCPNRIYVHESLHDDFVEKLAARVSALKVGDPFAEGTDIGPLINEKGVAKVEDHVKRTVAAGGKVLTGGQRHAQGARYFTPTVLDGGDESLFRVEETFGPAIPVFTFKTEEEAVRLANDSDYGLAAYMFTGGADRALRVSAAIESGMVCVNTGVMSTAVNPFGGVKQSGYGREGSHYGINEYVEVKSITIAVG